MNVFKVIGWVDFDDEEYPVCDECIAVDYAVIAELKEKGYKFGGDAHQYKAGCCPVINNGCKAVYSARQWGALMATALGIYTDEYAYMEWYSDGWTREGMTGENGIERQSVYPVAHVDKTLLSEKLCGKKIHTMRLDEAPYRSMERGEKTVEIRLNDAKRKLVQVGDIIVFFCDDGNVNILVTEVVSLRHFNSFRQLFESELSARTGCSGMSTDDCVKSMYKYYTKEEEMKEGVVGIGIEVLTE